jgi:hypothetical protein
MNFIVDNRTSVSHIIRDSVGRRVSRILFHLLKRPFRDSGGILVATDRRNGPDRRDS